MKKTFLMLLALLCLLLWPGSSWSRSLEVDATQVAVIKPTLQSTEARLLIQFAMPQVLAGSSVDFACVSFGTDCTGDRGAVSFQAFPLTKAWDAKSVSWTGTWTKAGGDWNDRVSAYSVSGTGAGKTVSLDITDFANGWLKEPSKNFGIIVKVSAPFLGTFSTAAVQALPKLMILY